MSISLMLDFKRYKGITKVNTKKEPKFVIHKIHIYMGLFKKNYHDLKVLQMVKLLIQKENRK